MLCKTIHITLIQLSVVIAALMAMADSSSAQELGLPPYRYFSPIDYQASGRNWSIAADSADVIYVANGSGVLRYDGISWQMINLPRQQIAYWVESDQYGNIYVGSNGEFGILEADDNSKITYHSLVDKLPPKYREFNVIWEIASCRDGVVFRSRNYLFAYFNNEITVIEPPVEGARFDVAFTVKDSVYFRIYDVGLARLEGTELKILPNSEALADTKINGIYQFGKDDLMIASRYEGMFIYDGNAVKHFSTDSDEYFVKNKIYDGHYLSDGNYAIATMANGIVIITPDGKEIFRFDSSNGLGNNQTLFVREINGQLWLGTKNGIFQLAHQAPVRSVRKEFGLNGQVTGIFKINDLIYATCNDGFYQLTKDVNKPVFRRQNKDLLVDCINAFKYDDQIYVSSLDGLFRFKEDSMKEVGNFSPRVIRATSRSHIFLTSEIYFGLYLLNLDGEEKKFRKIDGFNRMISQIEALGNDEYLVRSLENILYRIRLRFEQSDDEGFPAVDVVTQSELPDNTWLVNVGGQIKLLHGERLFTIGQDLSVRKPSDVEFRHTPSRIVYTNLLHDQRCLICYEDELNSYYCEKFKHQAEALTSVEDYFYMGFEPATIYEDTVSHSIWVGGAEGLEVFYANDDNEIADRPATLIREIKINDDSVIYLNIDREHTFHHKENDIAISYVSDAPLTFEKVLYQHRLSGLQDRWSGWSAGNSIRFNDLKPGKYQFEVRSVSPYTGYTAVAFLNFNIRKPWYATIWAYLLYILVVIILIIAVYKIRVRNLLKMQNELSEKVLQTTAQLARANARLHEKNMELRKLDHFKSQFFANISHDLRTPIMLLSGRVDLLKSDSQSYLSEKGKNYLDKLEQDSKKLVALTDEIQELVRIEEGKLKLEYKKVRIDNFFARIVALFDSAAMAEKIDLKYVGQVSPDLCTVFDPLYIERVMYNLIANALKFTGSGGTVVVRVKTAENFFSVTVEDDGVGIPGDEIGEIFKRNFQADNQSVPNQGMGIGLSFVREIVSMHHGKIAVRNRFERGTKFVIELPLLSDNQADQVKPEEVGEFIKSRNEMRDRAITTANVQGPVNLADSAMDKKRVLLVEDNNSVRDYMCEILTDDYDVYLSANGQEALSVLAAYKIDVIVTDLMMPVMDGFEFLNGIRNRSEFQNIPVLVVSARGTKEDKYKIMKLGINDIMQKPFDRHEFLLQIKNLLDARGKSITLKMIAEHVGEQNESQLTKLNELIFERISDFNFKIGHLAEKFHLSERSFFRMIKNISGKSPLEYVKDVKFGYVYDLIIKRKVRSLKEASLSIGMKNTSDFNKQFLKRFGIKADEILKNH